MPVLIGSDDDLRHLTFVNPYVTVKYHNDNFPICQELYPVYLKLSNQKKYSRITFVRVNADENPIAKKLIEKDIYSFMAIYKNGLLIESRTIGSEKEIKEMLDKLVEQIEEDN